MTVTRTGRYTAPLRLDCSCGHTTTCDTPEQVADRSSSHLDAAAVREAIGKRANASLSYRRFHRYDD